MMVGTEKPLAAMSTLEWLRYMNARNATGGTTPLTPRDIARLFAYIQLLEGALARTGRDVAALRDRMGLGVGKEGKGFKSRRAIRRELARLDRAYHRDRVRTQRRGWRGRLPIYTARIERTDRTYVATIDEMPGVFGQGRTVVDALRSITGAVDVAVNSGRRARLPRATAARTTTRSR